MPGMPGMPGMPMTPGGPANPMMNMACPGAALMGNDSLYFEATVTVTINGRSRTYIGLLGPAPNRRDVQVLNMYWK